MLQTSNTIETSQTPALILAQTALQRPSERFSAISGLLHVLCPDGAGFFLTCHNGFFTMYSMCTGLPILPKTFPDLCPNPGPNITSETSPKILISGCLGSLLCLRWASPSHDMGMKKADNENGKHLLYSAPIKSVALDLIRLAGPA